jgi:hypothetical protein
MTNCNNSIYRTQFTISFENELLELNITLLLNNKSNNNKNNDNNNKNIDNLSRANFSNKYAIFCKENYLIIRNDDWCLMNYLSFESLIYMNNNFKLVLIFIFFFYFLYVFKSFKVMNNKINSRFNR